MITKDNIKEILTSDNFGFHEDKKVLTRSYGDGDDKFELSYNYGTGRFNYPEGVLADRKTTVDNRQKESYVTFLCIAQLFDIGYKPNHIRLERKNYQGNDLGWIDILVSDNHGVEYLIIECKTADVASKSDEFRKAWERTRRDGDQLFRYFNTYRRVQYLCLFSADYPEYKKDGHKEHQFENIYNIISLVDNEKYLLTDSSLHSFRDMRIKQGGSEDFFKVWKYTYKQDFNTRGLLEKGIEPFKIGRKKYNIHDLKVINEYSLGKKYNEFALILRKYTVSSHENAFDKLINLFIAKIIDEKQNPNELKVLWKGAAYDDYFSLQDRLNVLYREGMYEFFKDDVTYIENNQIDEAFKFLSSKADVAKNTIKGYFRKLKYFNNNPFAFLDVHNQDLFFKNAEILRDVIFMLQDIYLTSNENNSFLGNLFEGYLNKGVHQSEGQFFSPIPMVRFLVSSLPLKAILNKGSIPFVLDYACGAGHFLTEYAQEIQPILKQMNPRLEDPMLRSVFLSYFRNIVGIEKDYRLSKVSQVAAYMYGMDGIKVHFSDALDDIYDIYNIDKHSFNILITNPPYAVSGFLETLPEEQRANYQLTQYVSNIEKNNAIETFFVERASQMLASGGVAAIILPASVLTKGGIFMHMREIVLKDFDIVAICNFGPSTFGQTSTSTVTLFLRRKPIEPDTATQIKNRVDAWFSGNMDDDPYYKDTEVLDAYISHMGYTRDDYLSMLKGKLTDTFMATDMVRQYADALNIPKTKDNPASKSWNPEAKAIRDEEQTKYLKDPTPTKQLNALFLFVRAIEREKLYYFMLAATNPQSVVIVQSPRGRKGKPDKEKEKKFLGYEWSNRKGNEGIHYLNTGKLKEDSESGEDEDDDTISQIISIDGIQTPLFNPQNLFDENKINTLIRNNFEKGDVIISDDLADFVSQYALTDLLDFSQVGFDKVIKTIPILAYPKFETSLPVKKLGDVAPFVTEKIKSSSIEASHYVTTENMLKDRGGIETFKGELGNFSITKFEKGDILVSNIRPYLKKIWMADIDGGCSNDVLAFRNTNEDISNEYLYYILSSDLFFDYCMTGKTGVKMPRGDKKVIPKFEVPVPPLDVQKKIAEECQKEDKVYTDSETSISEYISKKNEVISNIGSSHTERLNNLCSTINPSRSEISTIDNDTMVSFVDMASLGMGTISKTVDKRLGELRKGGYTYFAEGDILIAKITPCMENGKCAIAKGLTNGIGMGSTEFHVFRADKEKVLPEYLFAFLNQDSIREDAVEHFTGASGHRRVPINFYENLEIPILSLEEQQKVVNQISAYDEEINSLKSRMALCSVNKQAILDKYLK